MVPIVAPKPRTAPPKLSHSARPRTLPSHPADLTDDPFYVAPGPQSSPQLLSPFRLPEDAGRAKSSKPAPCSPSSPTKRRRGLSSNLSRTTRRRHNPRTECCIHTFPRPITSFDDLPWISALTIKPDPTDPWDIADLSLLKADWQAMADGPGPIRNRKSSLRSDPLSQPTPARDESPSPIPFPFVSLGGIPHTPAPRFFADPSEVVFQALRPIFPSDIDYPPRPVDIQPSP
ncbi:hypothetical protein BC628DRAFT_1415872 [Trametes gibbosa]|nr:hypothetical protein BC628DRAFT_1415872 [Trametes gibbosa]